MLQIKVNKVEETGKQSLPVFQEIGKRLDAVKQRAFELFQNRGEETGNELRDWLEAEHEILGWPAAELSEKDHSYQIQVALPGFAAEEVEVATTPREVVIHAAAQREERSAEKEVVWTEFGSNDVYRRFELPARIQAEKVVANLDKGMLRITAPLAGRSTQVAA